MNHDRDQSHDETVLCNDEGRERERETYGPWIAAKTDINDAAFACQLRGSLVVGLTTLGLAWLASDNQGTLYDRVPLGVQPDKAGSDYLTEDRILCSGIKLWKT